MFVNLISTYNDLYSNQLFPILDIQISSINKIYNYDIIEIVLEEASDIFLTHYFLITFNKIKNQTFHLTIKMESD